MLKYTVKVDYHAQFHEVQSHRVAVRRGSLNESISWQEKTNNQRFSCKSYTDLYCSFNYIKFTATKLPLSFFFSPNSQPNHLVNIQKPSSSSSFPYVLFPSFTLVIFTICDHRPTQNTFIHLFFSSSFHHILGSLGFLDTFLYKQLLPLPAASTPKAPCKMLH